MDLLVTTKEIHQSPDFPPLVLLNQKITPTATHETINAFSETIWC